jgi:hypothetical protein
MPPPRRNGRRRVKRAGTSVMGTDAMGREANRWHAEDAPRGLRDEVEPWTWDGRELPNELNDRILHREVAGREAASGTRGPASSDGTDAETWSRAGRRPDRQRSDQEIVTSPLKVDEGEHRPCGVLRFGRQAHWFTPGQSDRARAHQRRELVVPDPAPANDDTEPKVYRDPVPELLDCSHCGKRVRPPLRKGWCMPCYQYQRRHRGQLPDAETLRLRRWAKDAPITHKKGGASR